MIFDAQTFVDSSIQFEPSSVESMIPIAPDNLGSHQSQCKTELLRWILPHVRAGPDLGAY